MMTRKEKRREQFVACIYPLMSEFIEKKIVWHLQEERKDPLFLVYGNFPGKDEFCETLYDALCKELGALSVIVDSVYDMWYYIENRVKSCPENYEGKVIWFKIQYNLSMSSNDFSPMNDVNCHSWCSLDCFHDSRIGFIVTYECRSNALFGRDTMWSQRYVSRNLWRLENSPLDLGCTIGSDIWNRQSDIGIKEVDVYYEKFTKAVVSFANHQLKQRRKYKLTSRVRPLSELILEDDMESSGHSIDAFLKLVNTVDDTMQNHHDTSNLQYALDTLHKNITDSNQSIIISTDDPESPDLTSMIQKAAKRQNDYQISAANVSVVHDYMYYEEKVRQAGLVAEAKANKDADLYQYMTARRLEQELNKALRDIGGSDFDGDDTNMRIVDV